MTWGWVGTRGTWATPEAEESMRLMADHGVTWTALAYAALQEHIISTEIRSDLAPTVGDDEIVGAIRRAHDLGLTVCLKPVVNVADGTWRAHIGFFDEDVPGEPSWGEWFASYRRFILHAAQIAEQEGCAMLCVGCEMVRADAQEDHWRALIADVREIYTGLVTYNCDKYQEDRVRWWDAVDVISSSGYYPIDSWERELDRIERVVATSGKPFFFMEAGCPSRDGSPARPNDWSLPGGPSVTEQLRYFEEMFRAVRARPWVRGLMLWDWPAHLYPEQAAAQNDDYCPYGKPAGTFMAEQYREWSRESH
ncbi:1,4-beta-xylanase [Homoserinibacter sp. GY 40078]|uniref:glycoside hydrolase family 113 n=1 Tax=Homoserinibacter sp. GY 40078 TaxID=2603275 RepID=UPI0011C73DCA|nr:1,4-beta-xylanase [Homoserinibacter sp. GY 40078]TXK19935.1 1,4-beta-xylanase [Homoserinibacter sp. GY 40078]